MSSLVTKMCVFTLARVLNHISLERADHQHSCKVCGVCITTLGVALWVKMCNTNDILCGFYHILVHIFLNVAAIQIPHTLLECWCSALSKYIKHNTPAQFINTYILVTKEFLISYQNGFHSNKNHVTCQFQYCQSTYQSWRLSY